MSVIAVLSGKGGVGKTTVSTNLATALSKSFGREVVLLDSNFSSSHVGLHFGIYEELPITFPDVIRKGQVVTNALYEHKEAGIDIVPSSVRINEDVKVAKIKKHITNLAMSEYDYLIVDCAPGFGPIVSNAIQAANEIIVVTTPNIPDISDAMKIVELVKQFKKKNVRIIVNRIMEEDYELSLPEIESRLDSSITHVIHEDRKVPESIAHGMPIVIYDKYSQPAEEFKRIAASISGAEYNGLGVWERFKGLFTTGTPKKPREKVRKKSG